MFDVIGEAAVHQMPRTGVVASEGEKEVLNQKAERAREARPVEQSEGGNKSEHGGGEKGVHSRNRLEEGKIIVEQYDEYGKLVKRTPPGYLPFGETV